MEKPDISKTTLVDCIKSTNQMEKTTTINSTKGKNQMEKSDLKTTTIDSTKDSKVNMALRILLLALAITLGIALAFRMFYICEDTTVLHDPKFQIDSVSPSSFSVSTRYIHPLILLNPDDWNLTFSIQNPNSNYIFYYDDLEVNISYENNILWSTNVSSKFYQDGKVQTSIDSTFAALPEPYEYWIGTSIIGDLTTGRTTKFSVVLNGNIQISNHTTPSHISCRQIQVSCKGLHVEFLEDAEVGVLAVGSKTCDVISQDSKC